jgi:hypothetical protein
MADHTVDQKVMDELIVACIGPAAAKDNNPYSDKPWVVRVAESACNLAEAVYARRQRCINDRAADEAAEKAKRQEKPKTGRILSMKPEDMTGGMP